MIEVTHLSKSYGAIQALQHVNFEIQDGECVGLLGPIGAGKSTLLKILTGSLQPDEGKVHFDGLDVMRHTRQIQRQIGYLPENVPLYPELSVQRYLKLMADLHRIPSNKQRQAIAEAVHATGLSAYLIQSISKLSRGERQRVGLALAILHKPQILILDEPMTGLESDEIGEIRDLIRRLAQRTTVVLATHLWADAQALCNHMVVLTNSHVCADIHVTKSAAPQEAIGARESNASPIPSPLVVIHDMRTTECCNINMTLADCREYDTSARSVNLQ